MRGTIQSSEGAGVPAWAGRPLDVRELSLCECDQFETLPEFVRTFTNLRALCIFRGRLARIPGWICYLPYLRTLSAQQCDHLRELPDEMFRAALLEHVALDQSAVESLPESVCQLRRLRHLSIAHTRISSVPASLGLVRGLRSLNMGGCVGVRALPASLSGLVNLENLVLYRTSLDALPECIGQMASLRSLNVSCTAIRQIPAFIWNLQLLEVLEAAGCAALVELSAPVGPARLPSMKHLDLRDCTNFSVLPASGVAMDSLETLSLERTAVRVLPAWLGAAHALRHLDLRHTPLQELPDLAGMVSLETLNLIGCDEGARIMERNIVPRSLRELTTETMPRSLRVDPCHLGRGVFGHYYNSNRAENEIEKYITRINIV